MRAAYGVALLVSLAGMLLVDLRWRLVLFADRPGAVRRGVASLAIGVAFFAVWDLSGVGLGIFFVGDGPYQSGLLLAPEVPVEEALFLLLLCHVALVLQAAADLVVARRPAAREPEAAR